MATVYKVLAQSAPAATTATDIYTVGAGKSTVVSSLIIANRASSDATYQIAIRVNNATLTTSQYIAYNVTVGASDSTNLTLGLTLAAGDVVTVYASTANLTFSLFGSEIV